MKKESKYSKPQTSRFILLVIFILLIVNRTYAQCSSACMMNINIDNHCIPPCYGSANTYIDSIPPYNIATKTIIIGNENFTSVDSMTATYIRVYDSTNTLVKSFHYASEFNSSPESKQTSIQFNNGLGTQSEIITGAPPDFVGFTFTFTVNVFTSSSTTPTSRSYSFTILKAGYISGDPHITTVDGEHYDFQSAGEFVALRADIADNFEIQTRQTPVATNGPGSASNNTTGLTTCVSVNTAIAARVGTHRVSYEPNINGIPDSSGLQLRVDGVLTTLGENGLDLGSGARILKSPVGGIEIDFPDGASLIILPTFWSAYSQWYLNLSLYNTRARKGLMGVIPARSWLPALPDGESVGSKPASLHERFLELYGKFADAWRVTDQTSLFDYKSGSSTATFTNKNWPEENAKSCGIPGQTPLTPITLEIAEQYCRDILDPNMKADAILDVMVTGEPDFAKTYILTQQIQSGTTGTTMISSKDTTKYEEPVTLTAIVFRKFSAGKDLLAGSVEFTVDGEKFGQVSLDAKGHAVLTTSSLKAGTHHIVAIFTPDAGSTAFSSSSLAFTHTVIAGNGGSSILHKWWFWLIVLLIILGIIMALRRKKKSP